MFNCIHSKRKIQILNDGPHYAKLICLSCGDFIKWVKKPILKKNEKGYVDLIEKIFNLNGCKTEREKIPDECITWEKPYRIDLLIYYNEKLWGLEAKHLNTLGQGAVLAKGFEQIKKYKNKHFNGKKVDQWIIAPKIKEQNYLIDEARHTIFEFIKYFFGYYNVAVLKLNEFENNFNLYVYYKNKTIFYCYRSTLINNN